MKKPVLDDYKQLIREVDDHCAATGKSRAQVANAIVKDARFFDRLLAGGDCTVRNFRKVREWLKLHNPNPQSSSLPATTGP